MTAPVKTPKRRSWKRRLLIDGVVITFALALMLGWILVVWAVPMGDFAPVKPRPKISGIVKPIAPILQTNSHTCGFLAVSAIYNSYGLDPVERRLRVRLGTDNKSLVYDSSSTGSLHPDIYRTLTQDGFDCVSLDLAAADSRSRLKSHLDGGEYALALIKRRETTNMHWVVLTCQTDDALRICDSLRTNLYDELLNDYWDKCLLSVTLISPAKEEHDSSVLQLHLRGIRDMYRATQRK